MNRTNNTLGLIPLQVDPFPPNLDTLILNLNSLIGHFTAKGELDAMNTIWHAEQLIKNQIKVERVENEEGSK